MTIMRKSRLSIGFVVGVAATLLTRLALVLLTHPHSVVTFSFVTLWHWPLALLFGVVAFLVVRRSPRENGPSAWVFAVGACIVGATGLWLIRDVDMINHFIAGFWVK